MNFGDLKIMTRALLPGATTTALSNETLELIINSGLLDVATALEVPPKNTTFTITEDQAEYRLSTIASDFLMFQSSGVWWYDGSNWLKLESVTLEYMDNTYPNWRDDSSNDPKRYFRNGDKITLHPTPDTTGTDYGKLYYVRRPPTMTAYNQYPFAIDGTQTTEIPQYSILSDCILAYCVWKGSEILGKLKKVSVQEIELNRQEYYSELMDKRTRININADVNNNSELRYQGHVFRR